MTRPGPLRTVVPHQYWATAALVVSAALLTLAAWGRAVRLADRLPSFVDEVVNTEAALSFFRQGNYTSTVFPGVFTPAISNGLLATCPSALPSLVGRGSLFQARSCLAGWCWLLGVALVLAFL